MLRPAAALLAATLGCLPALYPARAADVITAVTEPSGICAKGGYLRTIKSRFSYQVKHVPDLPDVAIEEFYNIRDVRYEGEDEKHLIARQYCEAEVALSDGQSRSIWYLIENKMGFASIGSNVEFCVDGFDRWHVYNGNCRVLK
jgi:hypothetical protein